MKRKLQASKRAREREKTRRTLEWTKKGKKDD